jgi:hypothetical protein
VKASTPITDPCPFCTRCEACGGTGRVDDSNKWDIESVPPKFLGDPFPHPLDVDSP